MRTINKREREVGIKTVLVTMESDFDYFTKNPSADNYTRLEKSMLCYQDMIKNTKNA